MLPLNWEHLSLPRHLALPPSQDSSASQEKEQHWDCFPWNTLTRSSLGCLTDPGRGSSKTQQFKQNPGFRQALLSCVCSPGGVAWPEAALAAGATPRLPSAHGARSVPGAAPSPGCFISHQALPDHPNASQRIPQQNKLLITEKPGKAKPQQAPQQLKQTALAVVSFPFSQMPVSRKYPWNLASQGDCREESPSRRRRKLSDLASTQDILFQH